MPRLELVTPCEHGYEVAHYRCADPPYVCSPDRSCECSGGSRSTVSGFSPEAVQAAATCPTCEGSGVTPEPHEHGTYEMLGCVDCQGTGQLVSLELATYLLSAAWAHDFGDTT